jgi:hypothetical protein
MMRVLSAAGTVILVAFCLAAVNAQGGAKGTKSVTFMAEIQSVTSNDDHVVQKIKFTSLDKAHPYTDLDMRIADKGKFVYVTDSKTKVFTAKTVMGDAAGKKGLQKGKVVSIQLGGGTTVGGILELRFGPAVESMAKKDKDSAN